MRRILHNQTLVFFVLLSLFPTGRLILLGREASQNMMGYVVSLIPELLFLSLLTWLYIKNKGLVWTSLSKLDYVLLSFVAFNVILGFVIANNPKVSLYAIRMSYFPMLAFLIPRLQLISLDDFSEKLKSAFFWFFIIASLGLILYFFLPDLQYHFLSLANDEIQQYFIIRMTSIFWTPVVFGTLVTITIIYYIKRYYEEKNKWFLVLLFVLFVCIFMSVSRGAMIVLLIGMLLLTALYKQWKSFLLILALKVVSFISVAYYVSNPKDFLLWIMSSSAETIQMEEGVTRVELWKKAFHTAIEHPLGLGLGKAGHVAERFFAKTEKNVSIYSTDGWFLKLMNESGFIGLAIYLLFGVLLAFVFILTFKKEKQHAEMIFIFTVIVVVNIQNIVSNVLDFYLISYLYWLLLGYFVLRLNLLSREKA